MGHGSRVWRAYLSVERDADNNNQPTNARDRIGTGPWYNANLALVANNVTELHAKTGDAALFVDERGQRINGQWTGSPAPNQHDILTGSNGDGTLAGRAHVRRLDVRLRRASSGRSAILTAWGPNQNTAAPFSSWNSAHTNQNCADTAPRGGAGRFYCFAR